MKGSHLASRRYSLICPLCEAGELQPSGQGSARCASCTGRVSEAMLEILRQITDLPDALGDHACECGHPEMRRLPDGTFHCPACRLEVIPLGTSPIAQESGERNKAYWTGWMDGRFGEKSSFVDNPNLARCKDPSDRLDYYRGHRAGSEARQTRNSRNPDILRELFG